MSDVRLPHEWNPRPYQMAVWKALEGGIKRALCVWHRRAGKDDVALHWAACSTMTRVGTYWHMLPQANQARKAIWDAVNPKTGRRRIDDAFPMEIRETTRENDMLIRFKNGSTWQVVGSDNFNALVGSPPVGIVFSEYSIADPASWDYLSPILRENGGWAVFIYTPRGKNHGYTLYERNKRNPDWFAELLTVTDTGVLTPEDIEAERRDGKSEDMIAQEYFCSFEAANPGAYYGKQMQQAWKDKRITRVPIEPGIDCETFWDLGIDDSMSIWIMQAVGRELRFVQYLEGTGEGLFYYTNLLKDWRDKHQVRFSWHHMPHDIEVRELGTGRSRKDMALEMGLKPIKVAPRLEVEDGINAVRRILARCWFDEERCERGISALTEYGKDYDDKLKVYRSKPRHDWASHGADAFRTFAVSFRDGVVGGSKPIVHRREWSPYAA